MTTDRSQPYYANHPDHTNNSGRGESTLDSGLNKQQNTNAGAAHDPNLSITSNVQQTDDDEVQLLELVELASTNRKSAEQKHERTKSIDSEL